MAGCQMCSGENSVPTWPFHCFDKSILTIDRSPELTAVSPRPSVKNTPDGSILESRAPTTPVALRPVSASHAPAVVSAPGAQFRKNLWHLRNYRPELDFWECRKSFRNWGLGADNPAGSWASDAMRALTGMASFARGEGGGAIIMDATEGVFRVDRNGQSTQAYTGSGNKFPLSRLFFDSSQGTPTGPENVPPHVWQPAILYLGRAAQV